MIRRICIIGASGKLGRYMVQHALDRGYDVVGVCREKSAEKLDAFKGRIAIVPGATNDREVILRGAMGCSPSWSRGVSSSTRRAPRRPYWTMRSQARVLSSRAAGISRVTARTCTRGSSRPLCVSSVGWRGYFALPISTTRSRRVAGCLPAVLGGLSFGGATSKRGESQGLPVWSCHVGDPILESNLTRRVDFELFMVHALENDELIHEAPAIVGCQTHSALALEAKVEPDHLR